MGEIDFKLIAVVMLFVVLLSIQFTLNKILVILKDIRRDLRSRVKDDEVRRY